MYLTDVMKKSRKMETDFYILIKILVTNVKKTSDLDSNNNYNFSLGLFSL
jgi:hypothetical protein